jgi:hypothetical protein
LAFLKGDRAERGVEDLSAGDDRGDGGGGQQRGTGPHCGSPLRSARSKCAPCAREHHHEVAQDRDGEPVGALRVRLRGGDLARVSRRLELTEQCAAGRGGR